MTKKVIYIIATLLVLIVIGVYFFSEKSNRDEIFNPALISPPNLYGHLQISSGTEGSKVNVACTEHAFTADGDLPATFRVPVGKYIVTVYKNGYLNCTKESTATENAIQQISCDLEKAEYEQIEGGPVD